MTGSEMQSSFLDAYSSGPKPGQREPVRRRGAGAINASPMARPDVVDIDIDKAASAWRLDALCAQVESEIFHSDDQRERNEAKAICARCPVLDACRDHALTNHETEGVWGGMTGRQRRRYWHDQKQMREAS